MHEARFWMATISTGHFAIETLPLGDHVVEAWHERYGTQEVSVSIEEKETKSVSFSFGAE